MGCELGMSVDCAWPVEFRAVSVPMRKVRCAGPFPASELFTSVPLQHQKCLCGDLRRIEQSTVVVEERVVGVGPLVVDHPGRSAHNVVGSTHLATCTVFVANTSNGFSKS